LNTDICSDVIAPSSVEEELIVHSDSSPGHNKIIHSFFHVFVQSDWADINMQLYFSHTRKDIFTKLDI